MADEQPESPEPQSWGLEVSATAEVVKADSTEEDDF